LLIYLGVTTLDSVGIFIRRY